MSRHYIITGASGIAAASARYLVAGGDRVFLISREETECRMLCDSLQPGADYAVAELSNPEQTAEAFKAATAWSRRIDGVFAAAGASGRSLGDGPLHEMTQSAWRGTFECNAMPAMLTAKETLNIFLSQADESETGGALLLMSSVLARAPAPDVFATHAYASAKGAVESLTVVAAAYYVRHRIRINCIAPGFIATPMSARAVHHEPTRTYVAGRQSLASGSMSSDDLAPTVALLLSPAGRHITGQIVTIDAGWSVSVK